MVDYIHLVWPMVDMLASTGNIFLILSSYPLIGLTSIPRYPISVVSSFNHWAAVGHTADTPLTHRWSYNQRLKNTLRITLLSVTIEH